MKKSMITTELKYLIPSLLGFKFALVQFDTDDEDFRIRRIRVQRFFEEITLKGRHRYDYKYKAKYGVRNHNNAMKYMSICGKLVASPIGPYIKADKVGTWRPFCPFGIGANWKLFEDYTIKKMADEVTRDQTGASSGPGPVTTAP